jgi:tripartite-type tricarboxylate transporter receptor subunit TctC
MTLLRCGALAIGALVTSASLAQEALKYPEKPVRVIVPLGAGGTTDVLTRLFGAWFNKKYGQPVIVENRTGANGMIGAEAVVKAAPDGYTLLSWSNGAAYASLGNEEARVDTHKGLRGVGAWAVSGLFVAVSASLPVRDMKEFVAYVKANPGKVNYGTPGRPNAEMMELRQRLGLNFEVITYKGGAAALQALVAGEVQLYGVSGGESIPLAREGRIKLLAYGDRTRHPLAPEVPTVQESGVGLSDYIFRVWLGLFAPTGTPQPILRRLNADAVEHAKSPEARSLYEKLGWSPLPMSLEETQADIDSFYARIAKLHAAGIPIR